MLEVVFDIGVGIGVIDIFVEFEDVVVGVFVFGDEIEVFVFLEDDWF